MRKQLRETSMQQHKMSFTVELGINAKSFCNYYYDFYRAGKGAESLQLIRIKNMNATFLAQIQPFSDRHKTTLQVSTINNMKKGLG